MSSLIYSACEPATQWGVGNLGVPLLPWGTAGSKGGSRSWHWPMFLCSFPEFLMAAAASRTCVCCLSPRVCRQATVVLLLRMVWGLISGFRSSWKEEFECLPADIWFVRSNLCFPYLFLSQICGAAPCIASLTALPLVLFWIWEGLAKGILLEAGEHGCQEKGSKQHVCQVRGRLYHLIPRLSSAAFVKASAALLRFIRAITGIHLGWQHFNSC